ncbi:MAG: ATP-binding cassette domain-containing protein [Armatimonadetes bacterium]|nr:ATP-binding cassette domain-containing protein [Armatimonadota bacterium]MBS1711619.1 ATP-binding cassette domain-containing protein [Armatimonadota bacterium]MBX3109826.1 ATP-binding cassette domain-containing protein [Fimbriimonadaceae bacterium]
MVQTQQITKRFRDGAKEILAVDAVDFAAHPGEIHALLGVNGAGKTTLLRMFSTVIRPTSGTAALNGFDILQEAAQVRSSIGFLSTSTALYGRLTGREMLAYFAGLYGFAGSESRDRVQSALEQTQSHGFADQLCDRMSTGQKQRISIARAIVHGPPVLLFDEPTAGLDILAAQTVLEFLESARSNGKTIVFSTHNMNEVERLADRVTAIHQGRVRGSGTLAEIKAATGQESAELAFLQLISDPGSAA